MCFQNKAYDGKRGKINDEGIGNTYPPETRRSHPHGRHMAAAIKAGPGRSTR
jgi:hypothetical protein